MSRKFRRHIPKLIGVAVLAGLGYWIWDALQPGPILPGDQRWCQAIRDKPVESWTGEEALGYAQHNCMRWNLTAPEERVE